MSSVTGVEWSEEEEAAEEEGGVVIERVDSLKMIARRQWLLLRSIFSIVGAGRP